MTYYRRRFNSPTWHWMHKCQHWPGKQGIVRFVEQSKPPSGQLCGQCLERDKIMKKLKHG